MVFQRKSKALKKFILQTQSCQIVTQICETLLFFITVACSMGNKKTATPSYDDVVRELTRVMHEFEADEAKREAEKILKQREKIELELDKKK